MVKLSWFENQDNPHGFDMTKLGMDDCYLTINNQASLPVNIYKRHKECIECSFINVDMVNDSFTVLRKASSFNYRLVFDSDSYDPDYNYLCDLQENYGNFEEFGVYRVTTTDVDCSLIEIVEPVSATFSILTVFLIYFALFSGLYGFKKLIWDKYVAKPKKKSEEISVGPKKERLKSLDTFRGISIVIMIFVNYGAGSYDFLEHAVWNGLHLADLVFPWFMWIMGACIPISISSSFKRKSSNKSIFLNVLKRSIKLFCLGIFLTSGTDLENLRIFGVLQRFAISYFVVTTTCIFLINRENLLKIDDSTKYRKLFADLIILAKGWCIMLAILFIYCLVMFLATDSNCPRGYFGPGGLHKHGKYFYCTGGITGFIDRAILGRHVYQWPTIKEVYHQSQFFDPEGLFGCLPSIIHVFIGTQAGVIVVLYKNHSERLIRWCLWSILTGILGGALCGFSKEDGLIPINKNLWSLSYVATTCCFAFVLLSVCYILIDVKKWWSGKPFFYAGMNAILLYIGHEMCDAKFPVRWSTNIVYVEEIDYTSIRTHFTALLENVWGASFWVFIAYYLYKIKYFFVI